MGCDIHAFIEYQCDDYHVTQSQVFIDRWYILFGALAGVRDSDVVNLFPARGLPEDIGVETRGAWYDWQDDAHHASWLTTAEFEQAIAVLGERFEVTNAIDVQTVLATMRHLDASSHLARLVFWFDS